MKSYETLYGIGEIIEKDFSQTRNLKEAMNELEYLRKSSYSLMRDNESISIISYSIILVGFLFGLFSAFCFGKIFNLNNNSINKFVLPNTVKNN